MGKYVGLETIMNEVKGLLVESGLFEDVSKAAITGVDNLISAMPGLSATPSAIVNCPPQAFPNPAWRELALEIIIIDEFHPLDMEERAESACQLLDGVVDLLSAEHPGQRLQMACGAIILLEDIMAISVGSQHTAWLVETNVKSPRFNK